MAVTVSQLIAEVKVTGAGEAKAELKGMASAASETSGGIKGMLGNMLSVAAGQAIFHLAGDALGFLKDQLFGCLQESMDAADGMAQTVTVLKSTHDASGMTAQAVADLAGNLSHLTKFSDDTVQAAENMLLTFTNIGHDVFPTATKTVLDMAQALGEDTQSAAIQLGKALNDPIQGITALSRVGVTFTDAQKKMIKQMVDAGDTAGAQKIILQELHREFGGSAEAAGKTFGGQLQILGQRLDDVKQGIGDALLPILKNLVDWVNTSVMPVLQRFGDWFTSTALPALQRFGSFVTGTIIPALQGFASNTNITTPILAGLGAILVALLIPAIWSFAAGVIAATWPFLLLGAAVAGIVAIFMHFYQTNAGFKSFIDNLVSGLQRLWSDIQANVLPTLKRMADFFMQNIWPALQQAGKAVADFANVVATKAGPIVKQFIAEVTQKVAEFQAWWAQAWPGISLVLQGVWNGLKGIVEIAWSLVSGFVKIALDLFKGDWGAAWEDVKQMFSGVWDGIKLIGQGAIQGIIGLLHPLLEGLAKIPGPIGDMARNILKSFDTMQKGGNESISKMRLQAIQDTLDMQVKSVQHIDKMRQDLVQKIKDTKDPVLKHTLEMKLQTITHMEDLAKRASQSAQKMRDDVVNHVQNMSDQVVGHSIIPDMAASVIRVLSNLASQMPNIGSNIVSGLINGLNSMISGVINAAANIASAIADHLPHSPAKRGPLMNLDKWMPSMGDMLASGIRAQSGKIQAAALEVAHSLSVLSPVSANLTAGSTLNAVPPAFTASISSPTIIVQPSDIYLDGQKMTNKLMPQIVGAIRTSVGPHF